MHLSRLFFAASLATLTAACAVGPDFEHPAKPGTASYDSDPLPKQTDATEGEPYGAAQSFATGQDIPAAWWGMFHSEPLNQLIAQALKSNPDLAAEQAALRAAEENVAAGEGVFFPTVQGNTGITREKVAGASYGGSFPSLIYTVYNASVGVSYDLDVFGGNRRMVEELEAQKEYQRFQMEAARISLTANVVTAAVQEASLRAQIAATQKIIGDETKQRDLLQKQLDLGGVAKTALLAEEALLAQTKATLPPLEQQLSQTRHELSVLAGDFPSDAPKTIFELSSITLPATLPVSLPSQLVEQRPDVRAAEANLHAASAGIGVAIANRLPQVSLSAGIGNAANAMAAMFTPGTGFWSAGFGISQTIFDAGTLAHKQGAAEAEYDMAAAQYRKTVLTAFQDVADTLRALQSDAATLKAQHAAERAASNSLKLAHEQFDAGAISYLNLLDTERTEQQAKLTLVQAEAARYADTAALFQALGGGWWNQPTNTDETKNGKPPGEAADADAPDDKPHSIQAWRHE